MCFFILLVGLFWPWIKMMPKKNFARYWFLIEAHQIAWRHNIWNVHECTVYHTSQNRMGWFTGQPEFPIDFPLSQSSDYMERPCGLMRYGQQGVTMGLKLRFHGRSVDKNIGMAIFRAEVIRLMLQWAILSTEQDAVHPGFSLWTWHGSGGFPTPCLISGLITRNGSKPS